MRMMRESEVMRPVLPVSMKQTEFGDFMVFYTLRRRFACIEISSDTWRQL